MKDIRGESLMLYGSNLRGSKTGFSLEKSSLSKLKKLLIIGVLLLSFQFSAGYVNANPTEDFQTIYHVYLNEDYVGLVADEEKLAQLKTQKVEEAKQEFEDFSLKIEEGLSVIPERVFSGKANDEAVLTKLEKELAVTTDAIGIQIGDEVALHVKDTESYEKMMRALQLQFVSEEQLATYEANQATDASVPELAEDETRIANIIFSEEVKSVEEAVKPEEVLTVAEAVELINKGTLGEEKYEVQAGDVLGSIAKKHQMTTAKIIELNEGLTAETVLQIGDALNVTVTEPYVELEVHYESKSRQKIAYEKIEEKDETLYKGDNKVKQKGQDGEKVVSEYIREKNGQVIGKSVTEEQILSEPVEEITIVGTKVMSSRGTGSFQWPTVGGYISSHMGSRWGSFHRGIDIARPSNRSILAADNGVVVSTGPDGNYGNKIVINHNNGYQTLYAHLSSIDVKPGQTVTAGSKIGVMGSTGRSTGVHLHFEVTKNGTLINPLSVLK